VGLAHELVARGEEVVLFDIAPQTARLADIADRVKVVAGDLTVWPEVLNVVRDHNVKGIFHHGSMLSLPSEANPWAAFQVTLMGTMHVLEAARLFGVERVLYASTDATYGLGTGEVITDETLQRPITMYGTNKLYGELLGRFYRRKFDLDYRCIRYCTVLRPGIKVRTLPMFVPWMIENAALGRPFECFVAEDVAAPVIYYPDAVRATIALYYAAREQVETVCYNLSGITPTPTAKQLETAIKEIVPEAEVCYQPDPLVMEYYRTRGVTLIDDSRAREEWGWAPRYTDYREVVADFIQEVRTNAPYWGLA
jgi:threonine 3-dehydrogenase